MSLPNDSTHRHLAIDHDTLSKSIAALNPILGNTIFIQQLYKKYHWHVEGEDFYALHLLFDKHAEEQLPLIDATAERIRTLGGTAEGMPSQVLKNTTLTEPADPGHSGHAMITNLLSVHADYIATVRQAASLTAKSGDEGTNDLLVSEISRVHELQVWFIRSSASRHEA